MFVGEEPTRSTGPRDGVTDAQMNAIKAAFLSNEFAEALVLCQAVLGEPKRCAEALAGLEERIDAWGVKLAGDVLDLAVALGEGALSAGTFQEQAAAYDTPENPKWLARTYYVVLQAALERGRDDLFERLAQKVRTKVTRVPAWYPFGRLRPVHPRLLALIDELEGYTAVDYNRAGSDFIREFPLEALALFERCASQPDAPAEMFSNALVAIQLAYPPPAELPLALTLTWLKRGQGLRHGGYLHNVACVRLRFGDKKGAVSSLREALECGLGRETLAADPDLAALRDDPEFQELLKA
jgi:hypothetical protein